MSKLLYIEASPRKKRSSSIRVAHVFLNEYHKRHPQDEIVTIDLWQKDLPPFDGETIDGKYAIMHGKSFSDAEKKAWDKVEKVIAEFKSGDKYLFSLPMWNFGIPYRLKHYFDLIVQPGYTFKFTPETGYQGLVTNKKVALIYSRGGAYGSDTGAQNLDLQIRYMETILGFIGFKDFQSVIIEPTLASEEQKEQAVIKGTEQALRLVSTF